MKKSSKKIGDKKALGIAHNARIKLVERAALLRAGDSACCEAVADILEQIAVGADANSLLVHADARVRQKSATEFQKRLIAVLTIDQHRRENYADAVEAEVQGHIGAGSVETVRQARRQFGELAKSMLAKEIENGIGLHEWDYGVGEMRRITARMKKR